VCNRTAQLTADNRLVQRLQPSVCRVPLRGSVQFAIIRGIRFVRHMFSPKIAPSPWGWHEEPCTRLSSRSTRGIANFGDWLVYWEAVGVCAAAYTAKKIIQSLITAWQRHYCSRLQCSRLAGVTVHCLLWKTRPPKSADDDDDDGLTSDKAITMDNLRLPCLVVNVCRGTTKISSALYSSSLCKYVNECVAVWTLVLRSFSGLPLMVTGPT